MQRLYLNAGQMKAGTTFLYGILRNHPRIYFSPEKEVNFLSHHYGRFKLLSEPVRRRKAMQILNSAASSMQEQQFRGLFDWTRDYVQPPESLDWYYKVFSGAKLGQYCADFSNLTCTIPQEGLRQINTAFPETKVTYCVRDPLERARSHVKFHLKFAGEDYSLESMSEEGLRELVLSDNIRPQSQTAAHIENLVLTFGRSNVRIIRCENMWSDPDVTVARICEFLEIEPIGFDESLRRPVNVGPKVQRNVAVEEVIRDCLADEFSSTQKAMNLYADLVL